MIDDIRQYVTMEYSNTLGIIVYKNNRKVFEEYFNGADEQEAIHVFSIMKSITAILVGIAIDKGYIESVHKKILDYFPLYELKKNQDQLENVTIENFLTMSVPYKNISEPWIRVSTGENWGEKILDHIGGKKQIGESFTYATLGLQVLSNVLMTATGMSLKAFAEKYLFDPLEIGPLADIIFDDLESRTQFHTTRNRRGWVIDPSGHHTTGWGLSMTTDDFAKIGLMVLNKGLYKGKRILSEEYIGEMLREQKDSYGYLWWIYKKNTRLKALIREFDTGKYDSFCARGVNGSTLLIIPELDAVICMTCGLGYNLKKSIDLINNNIIPYIESL